MWSVKFSRLCYLAFLDCEDQIKNVLLLTFGALAVLAVMVFVPVISDLSLLSAIVVYNLTEALFVFIVFVFQILISVIYCSSFLKVAYEYDNQSWGILTTIKSIDEKLSRQYETDKQEARIKQDAKDDLMRKEIVFLREQK